MVQLMVRWAQEQAPPQAGKRNPDLAVLKLRSQVDVESISTFWSNRANDTAFRPSVY